METVLILRASTDETIRKLINELKKSGNKEIDCLVQNSQFRRYKTDFLDINFIDIHRERFKDLPSEVMESINSKRYDSLYITLTGEKAYNFWNVIEVVSKVRFKKGFFYNCYGEKIEIPRINILKDTLCRLYIKWINYFY